jgi:hypothetical protein
LRQVIHHQAGSVRAGQFEIFRQRPGALLRREVAVLVGDECLSP